jgi:hypothetical protein
MSFTGNTKAAKIFTRTTGIASSELFSNPARAFIEHCAESAVSMANGVMIGALAIPGVVPRLPHPEAARVSYGSTQRHTFITKKALGGRGRWQIKICAALRN